jgi:hypothetical protein
MPRFEVSHVLPGRQPYMNGVAVQEGSFAAFQIDVLVNMRLDKFVLHYVGNWKLDPLLKYSEFKDFMDFQLLEHLSFKMEDGNAIHDRSMLGGASQTAHWARAVAALNEDEQAIVDRIQVARTHYKHVMGGVKGLVIVTIRSVYKAKCSGVQGSVSWDNLGTPGKNLLHSLKLGEWYFGKGNETWLRFQTCCIGDSNNH